MVNARGPVLICGEGRSGTTLLSVLLDSHPAIYSGAELHFRGPKNLGSLALEAIQVIRTDPSVKPRDLRRQPELKLGIQFIKRMERCDVSLDSLEFAVRDLMARLGSDVTEFKDRAYLVESLLREAAQVRGSSVWGFKIMRDLILWRQYKSYWPDALFVLLVRDGRDVAASQLADHKSWGYPDIATAATQWKRLIRESRHSALAGAVETIRYEDLISDPRAALEPLLRRLGLEWDGRMGNHHLRDHIPAIGAQHPSARQVRRQLNDSSVGRFKNDLTAEQIVEYMSIAGDELRDFGYIDTASASGSIAENRRRFLPGVGSR